MPVEFSSSKTKENLMRGFAGESQARNRYTFAAGQAKKQNLAVIEAVFSFTANQEKEHAEIFYHLLKEEAGENIFIDGGYPVDISENIIDLLRYAKHNEYEEYEEVYEAFGNTAKEEGFQAIANTFYKIAAIEKTHGDRFEKFADMMEQNKLFVSEVETGWLCLNCGHIHTGKSAPGICPVCHHNQGYFIRLELAPFQN